MSVKGSSHVLGHDAVLVPCVAESDTVWYVSMHAVTDWTFDQAKVTLNTGCAFANSDMLSSRNQHEQQQIKLAAVGKAVPIH